VRSAFDYAVIRVMPRVDRGELINVGVVLSCPTRDYLAAQIALDRARLRALAPDVDCDELDRALALYPLIAAGDPRGGPIAALPRSERFHWLFSPRSTIVQPSVTHAGLCDDPAATLAKLLGRLVLPTR